MQNVYLQGQGPPPDPKYNFLADAEREEGNVKSTKEGNNSQNRGQKHTKGTFRRKSGGKDGMQRVSLKHVNMVRYINIYK